DVQRHGRSRPTWIGRADSTRFSAIRIWAADRSRDHGLAAPISQASGIVGNPERKCGQHEGHHRGFCWHRSAAADGGRSSPLLKLFLRPGARWFLDDGFRNSELYCLNAWSQMSWLTVDGIYPFGKGLATGRVKAL